MNIPGCFFPLLRVSLATTYYMLSMAQGSSKPRHAGRPNVPCKVVAWHPPHCWSHQPPFIPSLLRSHIPPYFRFHLTHLIFPRASSPPYCCAQYCAQYNNSVFHPGFIYDNFKREPSNAKDVLPPRCFRVLQQYLYVLCFTYSNSQAFRHLFQVFVIVWCVVPNMYNPYSYGQQYTDSSTSQQNPILALSVSPLHISCSYISPASNSKYSSLVQTCEPRSKLGEHPPRRRISLPPISYLLRPPHVFGGTVTWN